MYPSASWIRNLIHHCPQSSFVLSLGNHVCYPELYCTICVPHRYTDNQIYRETTCTFVSCDHGSSCFSADLPGELLWEASLHLMLSVFLAPDPAQFCYWTRELCSAFVTWSQTPGHCLCNSSFDLVTSSLAPALPCGALRCFAAVYRPPLVANPQGQAACQYLCPSSYIMNALRSSCLGIFICCLR